MHQHIEWDDPGSASVMQHFKNDPNHYGQPDPGDIISARYQGAMVRVKVDAYRENDAVSIGEVVAIIDTQGGRHKSHHKLEVGHIVRLPDDKRALETPPKDDD
nr:hypothetical protein [uncultured Halomonas sp.]